MGAALKENRTFDVNLTKGFIRRVREDKKGIPKNAYAKIPIKFSSASFLEVFVLYTLSKSPSGTYGMDILYQIEGKIPKEIWKPSHGNLYPILNKLTKEGYIVKENSENEKLSNNRKIYKITDLGLCALDEKLEIIQPLLKRTEKFFKDTYKAFYKQ